MKRTSKPKNEQPTKAAATKGIMRTVSRLQIKYGADPEDPFIIPGNINLQEPVWKGWVVAFPYDGSQYITCIHYLDTVYKLTPAGNMLLCPDQVLKRVASHTRKLIEERSRDTD